MNKKLLELLNAISDKKAEVKAFVSAGDLDSAKNAKDELKKLQDQFDILKDLDDEEQPTNKATGTPVPAAQPEKDATHEFANAVRNLPVTNMVQESQGADGGYTVPEDIQTKINHYKESHRSLRQLVTVENVKTNKGSRTYQVKTAINGFQKVAENGNVPAMQEPKFERVGYVIEDYAGYLPVSNDLLADTDANLEAEITSWVGRQSLATDNNEILALAKAKSGTKLSGIGGIKHEINVTLGSAYRADAKIVTNDDGLDYLDGLEDQNKRPLLNPDPTVDNAVRLRVGATTIPVEVFPNSDVPSEPVYAKTADVAIDDTKTYYTRTGSGTAESPYVYTAVEEPDVSDIGDYYEVTKIQIPFLLGDLKEAFHIYDRQQTNLFASKVASVTGYNAFEQRGTLFRADMRADYKTVDSGAFVNGYIEVSLGE